MLSREVVEKLTKNPNYKGITLLDKPIPFCEFAKGKDYTLVQLHEIFSGYTTFVGVCSWHGDILSPEDGDSYTPNMLIYGYEEFKSKGNLCIDILVDEW